LKKRKGAKRQSNYEYVTTVIVNKKGKGRNKNSTKCDYI
jgi:hypothetical protein